VEPTAAGNRNVRVAERWTRLNSPRSRARGIVFHFVPIAGWSAGQGCVLPARRFRLSPGERRSESVSSTISRSSSLSALERQCCIYACAMVASSLLLRGARVAAGLSSRALAERAGVSPSTVTRIEGGVVDPTVGMLTRLLAAAGSELRLEVSRPPRLSSLLSAFDVGAVEPIDGIDFVRLQGFIDELRLNRNLVEAAIRDDPGRTGSALMDNVLAAIAEKFADDVGVSRPSWVGSVEKLSEPVVTPGPKRVRARAVATAPSQLRDRNVFIEADSLWRERDVVRG
ncbi:MAG: hypothetical protein JWL72_1063, partial [Ilumatobacteraceae bacterium]|nr:hypothetical protein [Ilumatobacteraceae bacterium]